MLTDGPISERVRVLSSFLFEDDPDTVTTVEQFRTDPNAVQSDGNCPECGGNVYEYRHDVVCGDCSIIVESIQRDVHVRSDSNWDVFWDTRGTYNVSEKRRCVGGYPHVHDWVDSNEIDGSVGDLDPEEFYG